MKKIYKEEIFINNKFNYKNFEIYVEQNRDYIYLENNIDSILTADNCTEENIILIKSHFDKFDNEKNFKIKSIEINSLLCAFGTFVINFMINNSYKIEESKKVQIIIDNTNISIFINAILVVGLLTMTLTTLRWQRRDDDSYKTFAYTYLIRKMELIKELER